MTEPRTPAFIVARANEGLELPNTLKPVQEMPLPHDAEVVPTPYTPAPPLETRMFEEEG